MTRARQWWSRPVDDASTGPNPVDVIACTASRLLEPCTNEAMVEAAQEMAAAIGWEVLALLRDGRGAELAHAQAFFDSWKRGRR